MDKKIEKVINTFKPNQRERLLKQIAPKKGAILGAILGYMLGAWVLGLIFIPLGLDFVGMFASAGCAAICGTLCEKHNAKLREYVSMVDNHRILSIDKIASSMSISYEQARKDLTKMIERGFFGNAHIDNVSRSIVLPINGVDINTEITTTNKICPSCGATNNVSSLGENKCEYCGTILN